MQLNQLNAESFDNSFEAFLSGAKFKAKRNDQFIRISRNAFIATICSLILHALIFFYVPKIDFDVPPTPPATTIEVSLGLPQPSPILVEPVVEVLEPAPVIVDKKPKIIAQKPVKTAKPSFAVPDVLATPKPSTEIISPKEPVTKEVPIEEKFTDMASYVKAMQARRQGAESDAARQNAEAVARERGPTEAQIRDERIKRNFQNGTNGIFEITSLGARNATFAFRGWTNDFSSSKRQFFEVEAQLGQDVRLVMIKRMIALIREHYDGDFQWESHRLGRSVTQSARLEDSAGLEDFLMMEFFGTHYKSTS